MADVTGWLLAIIFIVPPLALAVFVAMRADMNNRLAANQLVGAFAVFILALMTFAFDQGSFIDLALCLALLSVPGTYVVTLCMERWL